MRLSVTHKKIGRKTEHRISLLRNLTTSLFEKERIVTTLTKAKTARPFIEKAITLGKKNTLHARRTALKYVCKKEALKKLFDEIGPRFIERPGGYTRIIKLGERKGDGASMAILELVDYEFKKKEKKVKKKGKSK
ncbi:MAG: 50S ribosomal protein L17 [Acidobacteriota bacterium]